MPAPSGVSSLLLGPPLNGQSPAVVNTQPPKNGRPSGAASVPWSGLRSAFRMTIAWRSLAYTSSRVPSRPHGSCWSMAKSLVHTCGHLKFWAMALTSNDCASVDESELDPVGRSGPVCVFGLNRFGLAPGLEITLPYHTNGMRPVKMPLPPRTWVRRSPETFQLKPMRGDHRGVAPGSLL